MTMVIVKNQLLGDLDIYFYRIYSAVNNDLDVSYCNQLLQQNFSYYALSNYSSYHFSSLLPCLGHMVLVTTKRNTPKRNNTTLFSRSDGFLNSYPTPRGDCNSKKLINHLFLAYMRSIIFPLDCALVVAHLVLHSGKHSPRLFCSAPFGLVHSYIHCERHA